MANVKEILGEALSAIIGFILGFVIFAITCQSIMRDNLNFKRESVERGYAEWKVDADGKTEWQWKAAK